MTEMAAPLEFENLLELLKRGRGFDFTGYKRASLIRRIDKRMHQIGVHDYADYADHLEVHPEEYAPLFDTILINVTLFFRDPPTWGLLSSDVLPRIVASKKPTEMVRVWSAGCASGEEAYTLAMVMAETMGHEAFLRRAKIYATDVDDEALEKARLATYTQTEIAGVPTQLLDTYFDRLGELYVFKKEMRRQVIFGRHDLIQDAPPSRIDLLVCRNTLMYFNAETQAKIIARFHFALNDSGFLFSAGRRRCLRRPACSRPWTLSAASP